MKTMPALAARHPGSWNAQLKCHRIPRPTRSRDRDILIEVAFADLNPVDLHKLAAFRPTRQHPNGGASSKSATPNWFVPGYSGSGVVVEASASTESDHDRRLPAGTRVGFLADPSRESGAYATHTVVDARCVSAVPDGLSLRDAATVPLAGLTAYESLIKLGLGPLPPDAVATEPADPSTKRPSRLLIVGGSGGVGSWATLLAKAWRPHLEVIVTCSHLEDPDTVEWCQEQGATRVIQHEEIDSLCDDYASGFADAILCLTEPTPSFMKQMSNVIRPYGSICLVASGDSINSLDLGFCFFKCANVVTETVFSSIRTNFERIVPAEELDSIYRLLALKAISHVPLSGEQDWTAALDETGSLLEQLASGHARGKLLLRITQQDQHRVREE